ncbi:hypothetical protein LTS18_010873 [Coniosporium uncinatum]|uniref:Uncharacterized protein n=1 Tax=Coniosporium uncinatum TaxID=93489 RepID=A0ACC3DKK3_9PEZI|nr:hypothetical protein LTS18_010873 [Coniosporium uncinatum]
MTFETSIKEGGMGSPKNWGKLPSPVVRVYDVARPLLVEKDQDTQLVVLPQPPVLSPSEDARQKVFVNCTESGGWYVLSEQRYPGVTQMASTAKCYSRGLIDEDDDELWEADATSSARSDLVGIHSLDTFGQRLATPLPISGPPVFQHPVDTVDAPEEPLLIEPPAQSTSSRMLAFKPTVFLGMFLGFILACFWFRESLLEKLNMSLAKTYPQKLDIALQKPAQPGLAEEEPAEKPAINEAPQERKSVRFDTPTQEMEEDDKSEEVLNGEAIGSDAAVIPAAASVASTTDVVEAQIEPVKPKKKAHRGQRGGKKKKKKTSGEEAEEELDRAVEDAKQIGKESFSIQPESQTIGPVNELDGGTVV